MAKHALLFLVHSNLDRLYDYVDIYDENFYYFIHVDKKSDISKTEMMKLKSTHKNIIYVDSEIKVYWGGYSFLKALLILIQKAIDYGKFDYIHTTSESNLPVRPAKEFISFFEENNGKQFLENFPIESAKWNKAGLYRYNLYCPYDQFNAKTKFGKFILNRLLAFQERIKVNRNIQKKIPHLYGGSCWFSLSYECASYTMSYIKKNPEFLRCFHLTHCPEEVFFQTLIMNSSFKNQVINDNLNYIDWEYRNGNSPANLDLSDMQKIMESGKFTVRKLIPGVSDELREEIIAYLEERILLNDKKNNRQ